MDRTRSLTSPPKTPLQLAQRCLGCVPSFDDFMRNGEVDHVKVNRAANELLSASALLACGWFLARLGDSLFMTVFGTAIGTLGLVGLKTLIDRAVASELAENTQATEEYASRNGAAGVS